MLELVNRVVLAMLILAGAALAVAALIANGRLGRNRIRVIRICRRHSTCCVSRGAGRGAERFAAVSN